MRLYTSNQRGNEKNVYYRYPKDINSLDDLMKAVRCDHIAVNEKNSYRNTDNYISSDGVMMDLDNTHSHEPAEWRTLDDVSDTFPDVCFYYVKSRHYMLPKEKVNKKTGEVTIFEPREKYHLYFPLSSSLNKREDNENLMLRTAGLFPYFDLGAAKPEQFFYGVADPKGGYVSGDLCLDEFMASVPAGTIADSVKMFSDKYLEAANDETKKAIKKLFNYLQIENPLNDSPAEAVVDASPEDLPDGIEWIKYAEQNKRIEWLEGWAPDHDVHLGRRYRIPSTDKKHPDAIAICVSCPWEEDHTENGSDSEAVIIVELTGQLDFLCRHSHGWKYSWKDFRAYYDKDYADKNNPRFEKAAAALRKRAKGKKPVLLLNEKGNVKSTLPNYVEILSCDFSGQIWLNALDDRAMLTGMTWDDKTHPVRDVDLYRFVDYTAADYGISNKENTKMALAIVAQNNAYHPIVELLNGLKWDGQPRIAELFPRYLGADRTDYTTAATKLLLYGAIQRVFHPGVKFDYCIILADTIQGTGKSTMCRFLALNDDWFSDSLSDMGNDKTAYETIRGHWIIELGEMIATRRTRDIEAIKAYVSREADDYRDPYGVFSERRPRQCVFIGTSNKPQFLPDDKTGNRRFIPILCNGKKAVVHPRKNEAETRLYVQQVYAEALQTGEAEGWPLVLDPKYDDLLNAIREASTPDDPDLGILQKWLDECGKQYVCSRMIWDEAFCGDQKRNPTRLELQNISDLMNLKIIGWHKYSSKDGKGKTAQMRFEKYGRQRAWERDPVNKAVNKAVNEPAADDFMGIPDDENQPF